MRTYTILIAENDEDERFFMQQGFDEASGLFEVEALVKNGDDLLEWLTLNAPRKPDVILSDLNMPGKNGYDLINELKALPAYASIPVIIASTSPIQSTIERCLTLGAADYIIKPETFIEYGPFIRELHQRIIQKELIP
ncbi:response regulator [Siphonobacter curvatus]|uniref:Response regulator n=1 Tax=Siphonobacter curvatus TaxID=2094562 RepID=A0A2S7IQK3_9BACT|nr:response regulator [Siphonobacter curvatus]PQA59994.1 response regulator [Siphonobacter curvatus]